MPTGSVRHLLYFVSFVVIVQLLYQTSNQLSTTKRLDAYINPSNHVNKAKQNFTHHPSWCPDAVCHDSALCHPCQRRFLIIIATGRSASTTLTYMMNSLPGVRMSGENNDTLGTIRHMISNIRDLKNFDPSHTFQGPWGHNRIPDGAFACVAQHMIETINPPLLNRNLELMEDDSNTIVGFKTIRFLHDDMSDEQLVNDVKKHFPCARILINIRSNVRAQFQSLASVGWAGRRNITAHVQRLSNQNERLRNIATLFGRQAMLLDSNQWTVNIDSLNKVVRWLGFHETCFFEKLLEFNTKGYGNGDTKINAHRNCRYVGHQDTDPRNDQSYR